jgi:hypothetical protein
MESVDIALAVGIPIVVYSVVLCLVSVVSGIIFRIKKPSLSICMIMARAMVVGIIWPVIAVIFIIVMILVIILFISKIPDKIVSLSIKIFYWFKSDPPNDPRNEQRDTVPELDGSIDTQIRMQQSMRADLMDTAKRLPRQPSVSTMDGTVYDNNIPAIENVVFLDDTSEV